MKKIDDYPAITRNGKKFINICESDEVFENKGRKIEFADDADMQIAVFRIHGELHCFTNICPHRHKEKIYEAIFNLDKTSLMCPEHGWTYDIETGHNDNKKVGLKNLKKFEIFEEDGKVYVEKPEVEIPAWRKNL